jgi:hypothetical protein
MASGRTGVQVKTVIPLKAQQVTLRDMRDEAVDLPLLVDLDCWPESVSSSLAPMR